MLAVRMLPFAFAMFLLLTLSLVVTASNDRHAVFASIVVPSLAVLAYLAYEYFYPPIVIIEKPWYQFW
jgi:hypothetical protein